MQSPKYLTFPLGLTILFIGWWNFDYSYFSVVHIPIFLFNINVSGWVLMAVSVSIIATGMYLADRIVLATVPLYPFLWVLAKHNILSTYFYGIIWNDLYFFTVILLFAVYTRKVSTVP